jgi:PAS domain S-box-containing protein
MPIESEFSRAPRLAGRLPETGNAAKEPGRFGHAGDAINAAVDPQRGQSIVPEVPASQRPSERDADEVSQWLAAIVASSSDAIIGKNLSGIITSWNAAAERIFGYTAEEIVGQSILTLIPPELQHEEPGIIGRIQRGERIDHFETRRRHKDGHLIDLSLTVSPIRDRNGVVIGASKIARDITAQKESERALREARDALAQANAELENRVQARTLSLQQAIEQMEEFSYSVSHDLRSPARAMAGYATAVLEDFGDKLGPEGREYLDRIVRNAARMDRLIQDLLSYGRLNRHEMAVQPVALERLVREIIEQYPEMQPPRAEIMIEGPLCEVMGHEPSLSQAISNLLSNAVKFVRPGMTPRVRVSCERRGAMIRLNVQDNGIGIPLQYRHRLFGMFERVHPELKYEGTGIGLAIVRKAVSRMGGTSGVESDESGGSQFWIELPPAAASSP